jgi:dipeptidase D
MNEIRKLQPQALWTFFDDLTNIPRPSKHEKKARQYLIDFAKSKNLEYEEDRAGNILICKAATPGMEERETVILQSHIDMVPQKNSDKTHDFFNDPIIAYVDGDWVKAKGTTLGADNGIGVAAMLSVLADKSIEHSYIEALFTVDEETGMTGAFGLEKDMLTGSYLINLDTEEEGELCVGCAGGINITGSMPLKKEKSPDGQASFSLSVRGLRGGHSGLDIHLRRGNANLLIAQIIREAREGLSSRLHYIQGGSLRNAIPREAFATVSVPEENKEKFILRISALTLKFKQAFQENDPDLEIDCISTDTPENVYPSSTQQSLLNTILAIPNGVIAMHKSFPGVVETSNNLAAIREKDSNIEILNLLRSSSEESKKTIGRRIEKLLIISEFKVIMDGDYPGWQPDRNSVILDLCKNRYFALFGEKARVKSVHAGLETGLFKKNYPHLDMISFGPNIRFPHSPDEKVQISSVEKFQIFLIDLLANFPA